MTLKELYDSMVITDPDRFVWSVNKINEHAPRYKTVADKVGVPWQVIAVLHHREASGSFSCHLHNGDPLTARTVHVPKGRPAIGEPPFSWEYSAVDALTLDKMGSIDWKDMNAALDRIERYNGIGYRSKGINTPYLWAGTNHYTKGKYVADGHFDADVSDKQPGCAGMLKLLKFHP
jgi:lysozyme family protein